MWTLWIYSIKRRVITLPHHLFEHDTSSNHCKEQFFFYGHSTQVILQVPFFGIHSLKGKLFHAILKYTNLVDFHSNKHHL